MHMEGFFSPFQTGGSKQFKNSHACVDKVYVSTSVQLGKRLAVTHPVFTLTAAARCGSSVHFYIIFCTLSN